MPVPGGPWRQTENRRAPVAARGSDSATRSVPDNPNFCFVPAYDVEDEVQQIRIVIEGMDETPVPVLDPGRGKAKKGYMWTLVRDERPWSGADPPGVVYAYAPGRGGKYAEKLLEGFSGKRGPGDGHMRDRGSFSRSEHSTHYRACFCPPLTTVSTGSGSSWILTSGQTSRAMAQRCRW